MFTILKNDYCISFLFAYILFSTNIITTNSDPIRFNDNELKEKTKTINNFVQLPFNFPNSTEINELAGTPTRSQESCMYPHCVNFGWFPINFLDDCNCESSKLKNDKFHTHQTVSIPSRIDPIER